MLRFLKLPYIPNRILPNHWYVKDCRKVPESWEKTTLPALISLSSSNFRLSAFPGT